MAANTLLFPLISGLLLLAIVLGVLRLRGWRHAAPTGGRAASPSTAVVSAVYSPTTRPLLFSLLVLGGVAGALAMVGAVPVPEGAQATIAAALLAGFGLALCGLVFGGVYGAVRGRGHDDVAIVHDFSIMGWVGANSFRTSHYPYAEEVLDHADRLGQGNDQTVKGRFLVLAAVLIGVGSVGEKAADGKLHFCLGRFLALAAHSPQPIRKANLQPTRRIGP
jgi:hypothetical protein